MILSIKPWSQDSSIKLVKRVYTIDGRPCIAIDSKKADNKARKQSHHSGVEHMKRLSQPKNWRMGGYEAAQYHKHRKEIWNQ